MLFPYLDSVLVMRVFLADGTVRIRARTGDDDVSCPDCAVVSGRVHSSYERRLADSPVGDQRVLIELTVRRLYCENTACPRRTFVEQVDGLTVRYGRRTPAFRRALEAVAVALAGRCGARFATILHSGVSRMTLLRLVMAIPDPSWTVPKVLGVDDFATRRGQHYGTVLIDCETSQPLDLLPRRDAEMLPSWLRAHPGSKIICRGRAGSYAEGARTGAPHAIQVADPFHLLQNLGTAVERCVRQHNACLETPDADENGIVHIPFPEPENTTKEMSPIEARLRQRHTIVHSLLDQGHGLREIARELHMGGNTVRKAARAETPEQMLNGRHQRRPSRLDPFKEHLDRRWSEGQSNAILLHTELRELGYQGNYQIISDYLRPRRRQRIRVVGPAPPGVREVTGWMMRNPDHLRNDEREQFADVLARCPELTAAERLVRSFAEILAARSGQHLKDWIVAVQAENLPGLLTFAHGLEKDWDAVLHGLTTRWNSGPVEGRVNHIKMVKRQMFGRAKLPLLRKRVLLTALVLPPHSVRSISGAYRVAGPTNTHTRSPEVHP
ncbi:transposase [Streptomyces longisporoflavus]|uniref:ISL3 family transposase n=1 Tax=Streptomyces longisporoflavus TaxID=28044 RepID=UPI0019A61C0D|nr:ISL3 family transposase [Streptomyces longisporoflavus]GGV68457.1 transposase [Streptomyces longisporoflavus]